MGTHPIFESDFDCLTVFRKSKMEHTKFTIKDPEFLLEKLTSLTGEFSKLSKDREMKDIFAQIEKLKSGLSKATEEKENLGGNSKDFQDEASKRFDELMKKSEKTKKPEKPPKAVRLF